jgi:membrane protein implicated in regulation of membrane protease activity
VAIAWIAVGVVLIAVELHHLAFYALFVAVGCLAAAAVAVAFPDALAVQVLTAVAVSLAGVVLVRPHVARLVGQSSGHRGKGVHGGFVGQEVLTLDTVGDADNIGHVELAGERWRAVSGSDHPLPAGTKVLITGVQGTTLIVWPADGHIPVDLHGDLQGEE